VEDPRLVHRAVAGFAVATDIGCSALSLYLWDVSPLVVWALMMVGFGAASLVVTGMFAVTVWPVVLLIAKVFDGRGAGKVGGARPAEPGAAAEGDRNESAK
jgi:hypothetical protein